MIVSHPSLSNIIHCCSSTSMVVIYNSIILIILPLQKHHGKGLCSKFHKLPFGARVAILIGLVFIVLASVMCCAMCCCRKSKKAYEIGKDEDFKSEFGMDDDDEAEPLPEKLAFDDKEVLIA